NSTSLCFGLLSVKTRQLRTDVSPSTSLPPLVEGQLRCFLRVTISRVLWTVHKPPSATFVRLRWWGESSNGTHFFPKDGLQVSQKSVKTTACFPIRCGPKQFTSYLTDMGQLVLEVLTKPDHLPIARAQVAGISSLSLSHPISGFYTLVSPTSEKLGELQVSLNLEPLSEAYDSSSSGPTTDINIEGPQVATLTLPLQPRSFSAASGKESVGSSSGNTPRGKDHLYFQNAQNDKGNEENWLFLKPFVTFSLILVLLERGDKLRNAMVASALKYDVDSAPALKDTPFPLPKDNSLPPFKLVKLICPLYLFSLNTSPLPLWVGEGSPPESLSGHSSVCLDSELNDPLYDQSLLENLFYKTPVSRFAHKVLCDVSLSEADFCHCFFHSCLVRCQIPDKMTQNQDAEATLSFQDNFFFYVSSPVSKHQGSADAGDILPGLSSAKLTLLSSIRVVRVTIDSLTVPAGTTPRKASSKGKPPRPLTSMKCTYFVEYVFPVASTSSRHNQNKAGGGEATRAVGSKVTGGVVKFHQLSMFPAHFSTATVKQLWETDLVFKIYSRRTDQKKPVPIGKAVYPLHCLLQSKELSQSVILPVQSETQEIGPLKVIYSETVIVLFLLFQVSLELATDRTCSKSQHVDTSRQELTFPSSEDSGSPPKPLNEPSFHPSLLVSSHKAWKVADEDSEVLLHTILMVPDGKNFNCGPMQAPNVYLNCKLFWCDEMARSVVSWGQANPTFNFIQVTPVALTNKLLERMKNNVMVIEVWQKMGSSGQDRLLGLVKLPLNQFYMSFRDPKITHLLLQAQYPVLGVDSYMPVIDVFSGNCKGNLRVILAMGRSEQIVSLQRTRAEEYDSLSHLVRPVHLLDHQPHSQTKVSVHEIMREHLFVIRVEKINGLTPLQSTVWGEADCYVQYSFPCQECDPAAKMDQNLIESSKPFRTTTTLCVPDPVFSHTETHVLLAPEGVPVQRLLLSSLSSPGLSSGGGVQFEVWCRYYYPNVRDQLVAKGLLPLSKLCAMVTMQNQNPNEAQMFSLPLLPRTDSLTGHQPQPSGLLDVCIRYKHRPVRPEGLTGRGAASRMVTLVVKVHKASGLQAAARVLSEQDERFSYFVGTGVNTYVTVQLSFLPESEKRCTRIVARTFCPEFEHHMEVSCDLLIQKSSGETCSFAEQLEEACAVFTVWNRDNRKAISISKPKDVMLGLVKIPLVDLIHRRTGISGWFGVSTPLETSSSQHQHILVGGLEISVNFAHHSDRERVIKAAQGFGWEIAQSDHEMQDEGEPWEESSRKLSLTFSVPRAWIPVHCLFLPGHSELERSTYCYFRYKFYDQDPFCSHMKHPRVEEGEEVGQATVSFEGSRTVELRSTQPLIWYLREEKLEVQVWVAFTKHKTQRPSDTDRLVGSAFVDLSSLAKKPKQKLTLSGVYPLFRRTAADLQGAALRVHITLTAGSALREASAVDTQVESDSQEELLSEEVERELRPNSPTTPKHNHIRQKDISSRTTPDITSVQHKEISIDESFPVTVAVDQAMHLNLKGCPLAERSEGSPCCCVSFVTADSAEPVSTAVISNTDCPVWDYQHECRLSNQLLVDPQQSLVFKVWHKGEMERVLGFASVDLTPLLCGFPSVCGWYNITDFSGQCHGQLKVSITPLKGVQDLRGQRKTVSEEVAKNSSVSRIICRRPFYKSDKMPKGSDRHIEHMDKVRLYHQSLQEQTAAHAVCSSTSADINPTNSFLFSALRTKLSELDNIQKYFSRKLSTPTFPFVTEQDCHTRHDEQIESETDTNQLLLKSNQLVGEVNSIVNDLSPVPSPCPKVSEHQADSEPEDQEERRNYTVAVSEDENEERTDEDDDEIGCQQHNQADDDDDDDEEDKDYDEVVVKPRHLNEVTSLTDKTSPWTSILTDPDLASLESLEAPEEPDLSQDEDGRRQAVNLETGDSREKHNCTRQEESDSSNGSAGDSSDTDGGDDERTPQPTEERRAEELSAFSKTSGGTGPSHIWQQPTDTHDSFPLDSQDSQLQPYP
uniref:C2 domain-containing protein n=1 Tax=Anabas testudineus TaxID=64144 RepID=A0A3Q1INX8_ANATE